MAKGLNAEEVLANINACIAELEQLNDGKASVFDWKRYEHKRKGYMFKTRAVCKELSIFDWWTNVLSMSRLKQMRSFVDTSIKLGFKGYVCFKVGVTGCAHGMWAHKEESTTGYSPDGDVLFHSFGGGWNEGSFWDMELNDVWMNDKYSGYKFTLKQIKDELKKEAV